MKKMNKRLTLVAATWLTVLMSSIILPAWAQGDAPQVEMQTEMNDTSMQNMNQDSKSDMDHSTMQGMDHGTKQKMDHSQMQGMDHDTSQKMDHSQMQGMDHGTKQKMDHSQMQGMDHDTSQKMDHSQMQGMDHNTKQKMDHSTMQGMDHSAKGESGMTGMSHGAMQGGWAPANARDPHAYSGGYDFGPIPRPRLADEKGFGSLLFDRLEAVRTSDNTSAAFDLQVWYGQDYERAVFKAEGEYDNDKLEEASSEILWSHAVHAYWNTQLGVRYDSGESPDRTWLAFGVQGLAPYWFEVDATAYIGGDSRFALSVEAEYELLLSQKLILQPRLEANLYLKDDAEIGIGSGLSDLAVGLRLRYEILREFAPYVGVEWVGKFAGSADYARDAGLDANQTQTVAGVRFWF